MSKHDDHRKEISTFIFYNEGITLAYNLIISDRKQNIL